MKDMNLHQKSTKSALGEMMPTDVILEGASVISLHPYVLKNYPKLVIVKIKVASECLRGEVIRSTLAPNLPGVRVVHKNVEF